MNTVSSQVQCVNTNRLPLCKWWWQHVTTSVTCLWAALPTWKRTSYLPGCVPCVIWHGNQAVSSSVYNINWWALPSVTVEAVENPSFYTQLFWVLRVLCCVLPVVAHVVMHLKLQVYCKCGSTQAKVSISHILIHISTPSSVCKWISYNQIIGG